jgi:kynurenine formamidase
MGLGLRELHRARLIDLSLPISPTTAEPDPPKIEYVNHRHAATELAAVATHLLRQPYPNAAPAPIITEEAFQDHMGLANENLHLDSHAGTHMDAPWHFGPLSENRPAKTIDQVPLDWCWGPGVVLDVRHKKPGETITPEDLEWALGEIHYTLQPRDIVLLMTGADKHFAQKDYFSAHPGMGRAATLWLLNQGIKVIGIDAWGFDRPAGAMLKDYLRSHDSDDILPAHMLGRDREYCHIEKMGNLDQIPVPYGFWVSCFPVKIERGSAGWLRAVAIVEGSPECV